MPDRPTDIVVISSHVSHGCVGNRAIAFALERLGFRVWLVPTIILPRHPGHGPVKPIRLADGDFADHLAALATLPDLDDVGAVLSGYLASPEQAVLVAGFIDAVTQARPGAVYLCDPVIGDAGRLYIDEAIAVAIRDILVPLADIAVPNWFEAAWLAGQDYNRDDPSPDIQQIASHLGTPRAVITSLPALMRGQIANALVETNTVTLAEHRRVESDAKGTGDLFAAIFLGRLMQGHSARDALQMASASVADIMNVTARSGTGDLQLVNTQRAIVEPHAQVTMRSLASARAHAAATAKDTVNQKATRRP
ncbi:MAG: pyridoxal kinase [Hyphomicrobiales bacterium]|nr:pyridoxal kinase [Hyphomicrobiales bacterium]